MTTLAETLGKKRTHRARHTVEQSVYDLALARLRNIFARFDHVAVSFSGGKDSTVCLQLALDVARELGRLPLDVVFFDEEAIPYQTEEYVRRVSQWPDVALRWYCIPIHHRNACSRRHPDWYPWAPEARDLWCRPLPPEALTDLPGFPLSPASARLTNPQLNGLLFDPKVFGTTAMVMGIRAQESITRERAVTGKVAEAENYLIHYTDATSRGNLWKAYPIYDWRTEDVWTAPNTFGWDYNRAYDVLEQAGLPQSQQRCSPAFGEEPLQKLWTYKMCFPDVWERMTYRVPGVNTAMQYALTELYAYHGLPEKPDDVTWEDFILGYVRKFNPANQAQVAARIKKLMRAHYAKTADPILEVTHPDTGLSWEFLLKIAMRGDFKGRKQPLAKIASVEHMGRLRVAYDAALAEARARGAV